ncbi:MAG TPA: ATP-binding protein [Micavibrio sp.]|nr:ATP-binding protein [Micavibrio sp.]
MICERREERRAVPQSFLIDALGEPAFVFAQDGLLLACNSAGRDILAALCVGDSGSNHHDAFMQKLRFASEGWSENEPVLGGVRYEMVCGTCDEGTLVRLMPRAESDHLLRLSTSLEIMPWGIVTVELTSVSSCCVFCNPKAEEFLKMPGGKLVGLPALEILERFGMGDDIRSNLYGGETSFCDHEAKRDGRVTWYRLHFIPYSRRRNYCLIVIEDTTEHKIREGQCFQAQRLEALGQLAGGVAHDFNNILSIIDGYARMGKKAAAGGNSPFDHFERIMQSVQRGSALTNRLLTFGRHIAVKDKVIDLGQLIRDQESLLRPLIDASITLSVTVEPDVFVTAPPDNICQILLNLCINARDAMPEGGRLSVECGKTRNARAFLRIADTGEGIPQEIRARIFDPFFTTKMQGKGTGLGLSVVYGLVKDMQGEIDVASKSREGASFTITLPLSEKGPPVQKITEDENGNVHLEGFTALIAEDEPALLDLVSGMVEDMGARVLRASNGNEALMIQDEYHGDIDFLLTDVVMPELNGVKLAELFESVRPESRVMFMSGYPESGQMARVSLPESAFFMSKPVDFYKLAQTLKAMAEKSERTLKNSWDGLSTKWNAL